MKRIFGVMLILVAVAFSILIIIEGIKVNEKDLSFAFLQQGACSQDITNIKSVGGRTLEEAYYSSYGDYLRFQAEVQQSQYTIQKSLLMILLYIGLTLCCLCIGSGIWLILPTDVKEEDTVIH